MKFPKLNLPDYPVKVRQTGDRTDIWDKLRSKYVALTPEEYVRTRFVEWLINEKHYPASLMANEVSLNINGLQRRADTLVADRKGDPFMVIEYKAPNVQVTQDVFDQAVLYNKVLGAPYLVITNGINHYCCVIDRDNGSYSYVAQVPDWFAAMAGPIEN